MLIVSLTGVLAFLVFWSCPQWVESNRGLKLFLCILLEGTGFSCLGEFFLWGNGPGAGGLDHKTVVPQV